MTIIPPDRVPLYQKEVDRLDKLLAIFVSKRDACLEEGGKAGRESAAKWDVSIASVERELEKYRGWIAESEGAESGDDSPGSL